MKYKDFYSELLNESTNLNSRLKSLETWLKNYRKEISKKYNIEYDDGYMFDDCHYYIQRQENKYGDYDKVFRAYRRMENEMGRSKEQHPDTEKYFIRFGDFPKKGKSLNYSTNRYEDGVSAYEAKWDTRNHKWKISEDGLNGVGMSSMAELDAMQRDEESRRPVYLLTGIEMDDSGSDGEPLLNIKKIKTLKKLSPDEYYSDTSGVNWSENINESTDNKKLLVYHGTSSKFNKFDLKKSTQGIIWFTSDKDKIIGGEAGAQGKGYIITAEVNINNPVGWEEYNKLGLWEIKRDGYDGVILPDGNGSNFDCFVFDPKQIKIIKTEKI